MVKTAEQCLQPILRRLDQAVFAAYGWPSALSDEEILERLLALNLERNGTAALEQRVSPPQSKVVNYT